MNPPQLINNDLHVIITAKLSDYFMVFTLSLMHTDQMNNINGFR